MKTYTLEEKVMRMAGAMKNLEDCKRNENEAKAKTVAARHELHLIEEEIRATRLELMAA